MLDRKTLLLNAIIEHIDGTHPQPIISKTYEAGSPKAYVDAILEQRLLIDRANGIRSERLAVKLADNTSREVWLRINTTNQDKNAPPPELKAQQLNYQRIFYSYMASALTMGKIYHEHIDEQRLKLRVLILKRKVDQYFATHVDVKANGAKTNPTTEEILFQLSIYKNKLSKILRETGFIKILHPPPADAEDALAILSKQLDQTKDWVALEKSSLTVASVIQTPNPDTQKIIILDEPATTLTSAQKLLFENVINGVPDSWFESLTHFQQQLVRYYAPKILKENRVIPSQLRNIIPLDKNTYEQSYWAYTGKDQHNKKQFRLINNCYHCGTPAYVNYKIPEEDAVKLTQNNLLQLKKNSGADAMVFIALNSELADKVLTSFTKIKNFFGKAATYRPDDSTIIRRLFAAAKELTKQSIFVAKIPLNGTRYIEKQEISGIFNIIDIIKNNISIIKKHGRNSDIINKMQAELNQIQQIRGPFLSLDKEVINLDLMNHLTQLSNLNNHLIEAHQDLYAQLKTNTHLANQLQTTKICFGCASGENRTGIAYHDNLCESLIDYLEQQYQRKLFAEERQHIFDTIPFVQHEKIMTGFQGSILGTEGMNTKLKVFSLKPWHAQHLLISESSIKEIPTLTLESLATGLKKMWGKYRAPAQSDLSIQDFIKKSDYFVAEAKSAAKYLTPHQRAMLMNVLQALRQTKSAIHLNHSEKKKLSYDRLKTHIAALQKDTTFTKMRRWRFFSNKSLRMLADELMQHPVIADLDSNARAVKSTISKPTAFSPR